MSEDIGAAQARLLLIALQDQVTAISVEIESAELRGQRTSVRGRLRDHHEQAELRRDLYEVHRLIDRLHRRFPETADSWSTHTVALDAPRSVGLGQRRRAYR